MTQIKPRTTLHDSQLDAVLLSLLTDITAGKTAGDAIASKLNVLTAKLIADAGVSDTDYATDFEGQASLTTTSD